MSFFDEAVGLGLKTGPHGTFIYSDRYSTVAYRRVFTQNGEELPYLAVYTGPSSEAVQNAEESVDALPELNHVDLVSHVYGFEGNEMILGSVRSAISETNVPIIREHTVISDKGTVMHSELIISNATRLPESGDVYPMVTIGNSYDGTRAKTMSFGLSFGLGDERTAFSFSNKALGSMRQIHKTFANTIMVSAIGRYVQHFAGNMVHIMTANFTNEISDQDILNTLELIERMSGKKRRDSISGYLQELATEDEEKAPITSWQMFLAICKFSTQERNINAKKVMEDIAERTLVLPTQMFQTLRSSP